jgi:CRP-like cAMP-binding protein
MSFDFKKKIFQAHRAIFKQGEEADGIYLVYKGSADLSSEESSRKIRLCQVVEKQFFGLCDFKREVSRSFSAIATAPENVMYFLKSSSFINFKLESDFLQITDYHIRKGLKELFEIKDRWMKRRIEEIVELENKHQI